MNKSIFKNEKGQYKIKSTNSNKDFLKFIKDSTKTFNQFNKDWKFDSWCSSKFINGRFNLFFEEKYLNFLRNNNILEKMGRINIELHSINQAFDYIDQYWYWRNVKKEMPFGLFFNYVYNLTVNFIYVRLRSLIDISKQSDNASINELLEKMTWFWQGINVLYSKHKHHEISNQYMNTNELFNSYTNIYNNDTIKHFKKNTNKLYKHLTTLINNKKAENLLINAPKSTIRPLKELFILFEYLKNVVYKTIINFLIPGIDYCKYPQIEYSKLLFCEKEYGSIFNEDIGLDLFNQLILCCKTGIESNRKKQQAKIKRDLKKLMN